MKCCQCQGIEDLFDSKEAAKDLKSYRRKGPAKTTQMLIDALKDGGVNGKTLLDIGGGVGIIQNELLKAGVSSATDVDASPAYLEAAKEEAERQGHADRISYHHGDFVDLAEKIESADVVTLDRVICCYHDMKALVGLSSERAGKFYGVVYPRDRWWVKMGFFLGNLFLRLKPNCTFQTYSHPTEAVDSLVRGKGLEQRFYGKTFIWQVVVYGHGN